MEQMICPHNTLLLACKSLMELLGGNQFKASFFPTCSHIAWGSKLLVFLRRLKIHKIHTSTEVEEAYVEEMVWKVPGTHFLGQ